MLTRFLRWLTRVRMYADIGMWYMPGVDMIVPVVFGVIQQSIVSAMVAYFGIKAIASIAGYWDVRYGKRIQYQNYFGTKLNPYLIDVITNPRRHRKN